MLKDELHRACADEENALNKGKFGNGESRGNIQTAVLKRRQPVIEWR